jgi:hypothetical protein
VPDGRSRKLERRGYPAEFHFDLVDDDQDQFEANVQEMRAQLSKILWALVGLLMSSATAVLLLALNLVLNR